MSDMKRVEQIKKSVGIERGLNDLGYNVHPIDREQQFPCDLHGDGNDGKFSARVYPDSNSWYCFACGKSRDLIETYRDKFGLSFGKACYTIEAKYGLQHIFTSKGDKREEVQIDTSEQDFKTTLKRATSMLKTTQRIVPMEESLGWWEVFDCICWHVWESKWSYSKGTAQLQGMMERMKKKEG